MGMLYSNTCKVQMSCMCHAHAMHVPMPMQATCTACTRTWAHAMHMHMHTPCACHAHAMHMRMHLVDEGRVGHQGVALEQAGAPVLAGRADRPSQRDPVDMVWLLHLRRATLERLRVRHEVAAEVAVLRWIDREIDSWVSRAVRLARYTVPRCWAPHNPDTNAHCTQMSSLYLPSCERSSRSRAAASSTAMEDLPAPEGPQRRISGPVAALVAAATTMLCARPRRPRAPTEREGAWFLELGSRQHRVPRQRSVPNPIL